MTGRCQQLVSFGMASLVWLHVLAPQCSLEALAAAASADEGTCPSGGCVAPWPLKGGDLTRSGLSPHSAPFDLSKSAWSFVEPGRDEKAQRSEGQKSFHCSPVIDEAGNVYVVSTTGYMYALDREGNLLWTYMLSGTNPGNPVLMNGVLYTAGQDGWAYAIDAKSGEKIWRTKVGMASPQDTYSVAAADNVVVVPASTQGHGQQVGRPVTMGNEDMIGLDAATGQFKYKYSIMDRTGKIAYNAMPAIVNGSVIINDATGGLYRFSLQDGSEIWYVPPPDDEMCFTSAGGPAVADGVVYLAFNVFRGNMLGPGIGMIQAVELTTGEILWSKSFDRDANSAPSVGPAGPNGAAAVVVGIGNNTGLPENIFESAMFGLGIFERPRFPGKVFALNPKTGDEYWTFEPPVWHGPGCAGATMSDMCWPVHWSSPAVGADGTVYINWLGGKVFALRDANGNGRIDTENPSEYSSYEHGSGGNGNPAIAPGRLVVASCKQVVAFGA
eukprot:gnl/TRDRNA2_/TRDRNA2_90304_c0_seq1.p1 gnl/TRDRNA2_/TRDRNA2_90304_c0~~gnl/TRDRNA2_/TRDRNA2_90304_c0_seq1.p1  ORF type:complete len:498 (+),score=77.28 gnl/TRDRNA2_/TRDRNA2_90304_c0_seq1:60-1553(+)